jgi:predicted PurR-regulated permease PerM
MLHKLFAYLFRHQVVLALFLFAFAWFLIQIREILISVFLSYIIMSAVLPLVEYLKRNGVPRVFAVLIPYLAIVSLIFSLFMSLIPFAGSQINSLATNFPHYLDKSANILGYQIDPKQIESYFNGQITTIGPNAIGLTTKVFGGLFSFLTVFIVSFYWLMYYDSFKKFVGDLFPRHLHDDVRETLDRINDKLGAWLRGEVLLMFAIGLLSWIALSLLGLPFALPLAILAGLLEIVPTLGPILSAVPAVIVAFTISPTTALLVVASYIVIQAAENHLLVPKIMQQAVGLNPVVVILSIMIGANLLGIAGALLAIPFVSFLVVLYQSVEERK